MEFILWLAWMLTGSETVRRKWKRRARLNRLRKLSPQEFTRLAREIEGW